MSKSINKISSADSSFSSLLPWLLAILVVTFVVYIPALNNELTNWDDDLYVLKNQLVQSLSPSTFKLFFTQYQNGNYHPLTMLSLALDFKWFSLSTKAFHITNVLLHVANTALVFWFLWLLTANRLMTLAAALIFGVHTMHVESVAWVAERKDVLYVFFFLFSLVFYVKYIQTTKKAFLVYAIFMFIMSALSKGQAVSLALTLPLIDLYIGRDLRSKKVILEKIPFLILALVFGIVAVKAQHSSAAIFDNSARNFFDRILFASYGFVNYLFKLVYPYKLSAIYPYPKKGEIPGLYWLCLILVIVFIYALVRLFKINKSIFFGLAFIIVNVLSVLQLLPVGNCIMADRYIYLSSIGYCFIVGYGMQVLLDHNKLSKSSLNAILIFYSLILGYQTIKRNDVWQSSLTLWEDTTQKYPMAEVAWNNLGSINTARGNHQRAHECFDKAFSINPTYADALANRGMSKKNMGNFQGALADLQQAVAIDPMYAFSHCSLGIVQVFMGQSQQAVESFNKALALNPAYADAYSGMGAAKTQLGKLPEALADFDKAVALNPVGSEIYANRGIARAQAKDIQGAISDFNKAIQLKPDYGGAYLNLAIAYSVMGDKQKACEYYHKGIQCTPPATNQQLDSYCK